MIAIIIKLAVTLLLLFIVFSHVEIALLKEILVDANPLLLALSVGLYSCTFLVGGIRWWYISNHLGVTTTINFCVRIFYIAGFFSQVIVGGGYGGDVYRVWMLAKATKDKGRSFVSVLVDRLSGILSAIIILALLGPLYWYTFPGEHAFIGASFLSVAVLVVFKFAMLLSERTTKLKSPYLIRLPRSEVILSLANSVKILFEWPVSCIHVAWSIIVLILNTLALVAIGLALNIEIDPFYYFLLWPIIFLSKSFPLSIAGWGAREIAMIFFFGFVGVSQESALGMSLLSGILLLLGSSVGMVLWLQRHTEVPKKPLS